MMNARVSSPVVCAAALLSITFGTTAMALEAVTPVQTLDFGKIIVRNNNAVYSAIVSPAGALSAHSNFVFLNAPRNGIYTISVNTPSTAVTLSFNPAPVAISCSCGGPDLSLVNLAFTPSSLTSDGSGNVTVNLGGTLRTSGSGIGYNDSPYSGTITFNVDY